MNNIMAIRVDHRVKKAPEGQTVLTKYGCIIKLRVGCHETSPDFCAEDGDNPNRAELSGYICKAPVYRTTPFNREICDLLLAVNRAYNKSDYIPCIAWGRNARFVHSIEVGQKLAVSGRIQSREYVKKLSETDAETRVAYELSINKISLEEEADGENEELEVRG